MKKLTFIIILFLPVVFFAQLNDNNLNAIDLTAGYAENGYGGKVSYIHYLNQARRNDYLQISVLYTDSNISMSTVDLSYNLLTLNLGYYYNISLDSRNKLNLNIGGGVTGGIEEINNGEKELETGAELSSTGGFVYGPYLGIELEFYLSDKISLTLQANEYYHVNSEIGDFTLFVGGGFRIFF